MDKATIRVVTIIPTVDTSAYAAGDGLITGAIELPKAVWGKPGQSMLEAIHVIDSAKQKAALDFLFFSSEPTVASAINAALDITDAEMASKFAGLAKVVAADYVDLANNSVASVKDIRLLMRSKAKATGASATAQKLDSLWLVFAVRTTPTYVAATDLKIELHFRQ